MKANVYRVEYTINGERVKRYLRGEERKDKFVQQAKQLGIVHKVLKCYPINMEQNQHNFELISNVCANAQWDMVNGDIPYNEKKYDMLEEARKDAERFFCAYGQFNSPVSWFVWEDYKRAKDLIAWANNHRMEACERAGVPYIQ